jgi:hypothetical protein
MSENQHTQVKVSVDSQTAAAFKQACLNSGVSMAAVLSAYMAKFGKSAQSGNSPSSLSTKRQRRTAVEKIIAQLRLIADAEQSYLDRIPDNLHSSTFSDSAESWLSALDDAIDSLLNLP